MQLLWLYVKSALLFIDFSDMTGPSYFVLKLSTLWPKINMHDHNINRLACHMMLHLHYFAYNYDCRLLLIVKRYTFSFSEKLT